MNNSNKVKLNPRKVFWKCGACGRLFTKYNQYYHPEYKQQRIDDDAG